MGAPPKTFSIESLQSLKLIAYPPNAFRPFAMSSSSFVGRVTVPWPGGITTTGTRGEKVKIPSLGGLQTSGKYPGGVSGGSRGWCPDARLQRAWNARITPRANPRSGSLNSLGGRPGAPDHVLAELLPAPVLGAGVAVRPHHVVEDLLAVEGHHGLEVLAGHVVDGLAARDRHPDLHGQVLRPRHTRDLAELVATVLHRRRAVVALAVVAERLLVEALEQEVDLLLEQLPVRRLVDDGRPERLDLPRVVAASHAHDHATVGHDVRHRVVLGEADGVPHREDVEGAAELEAPRLRGEPERELDQVRETLVALALEVVLRRPQRVVPELVHQLGDVPRGEEHLAQPLVAVAPGVRRRALRSDVLQLDLADVERVKSFDHRAVHPPSMTSVCRVT